MPEEVDPAVERANDPRSQNGTSSRRQELEATLPRRHQNDRRLLAIGSRVEVLRPRWPVLSFLLSGPLRNSPQNIQLQMRVHPNGQKGTQPGQCFRTPLSRRKNDHSRFCSSACRNRSHWRTRQPLSRLLFPGARSPIFSLKDMKSKLHPLLSIRGFFGRRSNPEGIRRTVFDSFFRKRPLDCCMQLSALHSRSLSGSTKSDAFHSPGSSSTSRLVFMVTQLGEQSCSTSGDHIRSEQARSETLLHRIQDSEASEARQTWSNPARYSMIEDAIGRLVLQLLRWVIHSVTF